MIDNDVTDGSNGRLSEQGTVLALPEENSISGLWKPKEVAAKLKVKPRTIYAWILSGKLEAIRTPGGQLRIHASQVSKLLSDFVIDDEEAQVNTP